MPGKAARPEMGKEWSPYAVAQSAAWNSPIRWGEGLTPSRFAVRASFQADISGGIGEDIGYAATFRVLSTSVGGCGGES